MFIDSDQVSAQLAQVVAETPLDLAEARPLTRCTVCNATLLPAARDEVWDRIPPYIYLTHESYARCPDCGRVYWEGTHAPRIRRELDRLSRSARDGARRE